MTDPHSAPSDTAPRPCFLVGPPRSGTTWLQRMLQAHPAICGGEESHFFTLFGSTLARPDGWMADEDRQIGPLLYMDRPDYEAALREVWRRMFARLYAENPTARVHLEKTPEHALSLDEIARLFPGAPVILLVRDSRAVTASLLHAAASWGRGWAPATARAAATVWRRYAGVALAWRDRHPDHPLLVVRYEDLLEGTEREVERVLRFVLPADVDPDVAGTMARHAAGTETARDPQGFRRLRGRDGWRADLSAVQKLVVWRLTRKLMRRLDYDIRPF